MPAHATNEVQIILKDLRKILTSLGDRLLDSEVSTLLSVLGGDADQAAATSAKFPSRSPSLLSSSPPTVSDSAAGESAGSAEPSDTTAVVDEPDVVCDRHLRFLVSFLGWPSLM
jgi:hypothetical protein